MQKQAKSMKRIGQVLLAIAMCVVVTSCSKELSRSAAAKSASPETKEVSLSKPEDFTKNSGLKFNDGIGFYVAYDGAAHLLIDWDAKKVLEIPPTAQLYAYGMDFSSVTPQPSIWGYCFNYLPIGEKEWNVNSGGYVLRGGWHIRFFPVSGYDQKLYRLVFGGAFCELRDGKIPHQYWVFNFPGETQIRFRFVNEKTQREKEAVESILSNKDKTPLSRAASMRSDQTDGSAHAQRARVSSSCVGVTATNEDGASIIPAFSHSSSYPR